jgi:hypothetical protein
MQFIHLVFESLVHVLGHVWIYDYEMTTRNGPQVNIEDA